MLLYVINYMTLALENILFSILWRLYTAIFSSFKVLWKCCIELLFLWWERN